MISDCEDPNLEYGPPASKESLAELEAALGVELPAHLRGFLETNDGLCVRNAYLYGSSS